MNKNLHSNSYITDFKNTQICKTDVVTPKMALRRTFADWWHRQNQLLTRSDCNGTRNYNHILCKETLNY